MKIGVIGFVTTFVIGVGLMGVLIWNIQTQFKDEPWDTAQNMRQVAIEIGDVRGPGVFERAAD